MDMIIIDAIRTMKEKKKRPSIENIYDYAKKENNDLNDDEFVKDFKELESRKVIINSKPNESYGSYQVCLETLSILFFEKQRKINIENSNNEEIINILQNQLDTLKTELIRKNDIIDNLISAKNKEIEIIEIERMQTTNDNKEKMNFQKSGSEPASMPSSRDDEDNQNRIAMQIETQIKEFRKDKHMKYLKERELNFNTSKNKEQEKEKSESSTNQVHRWPPGTTLIAGDSIVSGLMEKKMGKNNVKVRSFPGACMRDMYYYLEPLLMKCPTNVILHACTNDAIDKEPHELTDELLQLKHHVENTLPGSNVIISYPTIRTDKQQAKGTIINLRKTLDLLQINSITNENITEEHLGKGGLHLNAKDSGRLAMNYISFIRHL